MKLKASRVDSHSTARAVEVQLLVAFESCRHRLLAQLCQVQTLASSDLF